MLGFLAGAAGAAPLRARRRGAMHPRRHAAAVIVASRGSASRDEVFKMVTAQDNFNRLRGVNMARELDAKDCLDMLAAASGDPDLNVRYAAVSQLAEAGKVDPERTLGILRDLAQKETDTSVRSAMADAICAIGLKEAYYDLVPIYRESRDMLVKFSILAGLGELGNPDAFDLLVEAVEKEEALLKVAAIGSLGELGDPRGIEIVRSFVDSDDEAIRDRAQIALVLLENK